MCIYNANKAARASKGDSLEALAEKLISPSDAKLFDTQQESPHNTPKPAGYKVGKDLEKALKMAQKESRLIIGVSAAVKFLAAAPEDSLFCILAPPKCGDSAGHIQEVLLKAFCFENDIYIVQVCVTLFVFDFQFKLLESWLIPNSFSLQVDSAERLSSLLNIGSPETCMLIQKSRLNGSSEEILSYVEDAIIDFCEENWDAPKQPVIQLPNT